MSIDQVAQAILNDDLLSFEKLFYECPENYINMSVEINDEEFTLLFLAIFIKNKTIINKLLEYGESPDNMCYIDDRFTSPLLYCCEYNIQEILGILVNYSNLEYNDPNFENPLYLCCMNNNYECALILSEYIKYIDVNYQTKKYRYSNYIALMNSAGFEGFKQNIKFFNLLNEINCDINLIDYKGKTVKDYFNKNRNKFNAQFIDFMNQVFYNKNALTGYEIRKINFEKNQISNFEKNHIHDCCRFNNIYHIKNIQKYINIPDHKGNLPIHIAVKHLNIATIKIIIEYSNIYYKNKKNNDVFDIIKNMYTKADKNNIVKFKIIRKVYNIIKKNYFKKY